MADIFTSSSAYQGTFVVGSFTSDPHFQICAIANITASQHLKISFWINQNGLRLDANLGNADYRIRDSSGALISGLAQVGVAPDVNGYFHPTPVAAASIYDLEHYILEVDIPVEGISKSSSIGLVRGE